MWIATYQMLHHSAIHLYSNTSITNPILLSNKYYLSNNIITHLNIYHRHCWNLLSNLNIPFSTLDIPYKYCIYK